MEYKWCAEFNYQIGFYRPVGTVRSEYDYWLYNQINSIKFAGKTKYFIDNQLYLDLLDDVILVKCTLHDHIKYIVDQKNNKLLYCTKLIHPETIKFGKLYVDKKMYNVNI